MKLLASLILPTLCQDYINWAEIEEELAKEVTEAPECGFYEKWDSCGNFCKEKNCKDRGVK